MGADRVEIMGIPTDRLGEWFESVGERRFRAKQVAKWIYDKEVFDFERMTDLPKPLRAFLAEHAKISLPEVVEVARADDGAAKFLFELDDGKKTEAVYIPDPSRDRHTVCLSCQVGCRWGCRFCATGRLGFMRNLSSTEIIGQLFHLRSYIRLGGHKLSNVVFMGMGEPLDNTEAVLDAIKVILSDYGFGLGHRRVLVSTAGIPEGIRALMESGLKPKLAISLNAPNNELRSRIMPINERYPIESWIGLVEEYANYCRRWVTFEYVLFDGVNDSLTHADELVRLIKDLPAKVNLIPYNEVEGAEFSPPDERKVLRFQSYLLSNGIVATIRKSKGGDVCGACGQLAGKAVMQERG